MSDHDATALVLVRRLDWRFLLPDPALERVVYLGPSDAALPLALRRFAGSLVMGDPGGDVDGTFDVAVVASRRSEDVERAAALLKPGGHLYWEVDRKWVDPGTSGYLDDPRHRAGSLGLQDVRVHWHHPDLEEARMIFPPVSSAVLYALGRRSAPHPFLGQLIAAAVPWLLLPRVLPSLSVVARKPGGRTMEALPAAAEHANIADWGTGSEERPYVLLTPRFRASRHVITALLEPATGEAVAVAKTARMPGDSASLRREARALWAASAALPASASVPRVEALVTGGHSTLVESAMAGRLLTPDEIRRDPEGWTRAVVDWITTLHRATREPTAGRNLRELWVVGPLGRIEDEISLGGEEADLVERTRRWMRALDDLDLPSVLEHGDVSCPNILVSKEERLGIVDWERADLTGVPGSDLFFFLAFVAVSRENAVTAEQAVAAFRTAFRGPAAWARPYVTQYWNDLDLPSEAVAPLFVASWARRVAGLSGRSRRYIAFLSEACDWADEIGPGRDEAVGGSTRPRDPPSSSNPSRPTGPTDRTTLEA